MRPSLIIAAGFAVLPILCGPAWAQNNRSFVSGLGSDSNPCTLGAPCRSFAFALTQTNAGGEITVLDSAGYGVVTINKSITITNPGGVEAGITAQSGQTAIAIAPSSNAVVTLRGLTLEGGGVGQNGIVLENTTGQARVNIIDCVVQNFAGIGIAIIPSLSGPGPGADYIVIANSFVLNNAGSGIEIFPQSGNTLVWYAIDHTTVAGNGTNPPDAGILANNSIGAIIGSISSVYVHQNRIGVNFQGNGSNVPTTIKNSVLSGSNTDLINNSTATVTLYDANQIDFLNNTQTIDTDGTNNINGIQGGGTFTPLTRH